MEHGTISSHASQLEQLVLDALQDMQRLGYSPKILSWCLAGFPQLQWLRSRGPLRAGSRAIPHQPRYPHAPRLG